jgi:hypothetical protein
VKFFIYYKEPTAGCKVFLKPCLAAENSNKTPHADQRPIQSITTKKQHHESVLTKNSKKFPHFKFSSVKTPNARMLIKFNGKFFPVGKNWCGISVEQGP